MILQLVPDSYPPTRRLSRTPPRATLSLLFCLVATAASSFQPYTLKVKTCNATEAGTVGQLLLSFCDGDESCLMGPPNEYNSGAELDAIGEWNTLQVPLEYQPTTMSMTIVGDDAW